MIASALEDDFWFFERTAADDLANVPTNRHVESTELCLRCQEPMSLSVWKARAQKDIDEMRHLRAGSKTMYLETAAKYYQLDFSQKARYSNDERCALTHEQFWISKTPRSEDPFFAPIDSILQLCGQAQQALNTSKTPEDVKEAFGHINKARAELGSIIAPLDLLLTGVELMFEAKSKHRDNSFDSNGLASVEGRISIPKALDYFARMEDWGDEAMETVVRLFKE